MSIDSTDTDALRYLWTPDLDPLFSREARACVISAWHGHIPFAHWIVGAVKPRCLVELGTHNGASYSAFCEAVMHNGLDARCYAVDTWKGDDQAGHYGEEVYLDFRRFHDERYSAFSELLRCTFDEALPCMTDASVDLLHIDGLHTFDAVQHDFENWRPKLSDHGVVLFHDTNVRERGFGVWRLWEDLRMQFPSFEFLHGHGLGILAVGHSVSPEVRALCTLRDPTHVNAVRQRFCLLGERWMLLARLERLQNEEVAPRDVRIQLLEEEVVTRDARMSSLEKEVARLKDEAASRNVAERELREQLHTQSSQSADKLRQLEEQLHTQSSQSADKVRQLEEQLHTQAAQICQFEEQLRSQASESADKVRRLEEQVVHLNLALGEARRLCDSMISSLSWRLTRPFRVLRDAGVVFLNKVRRRENS